MHIHKTIAIAVVGAQIALLIYFGEEVRNMIGYRLLWYFHWSPTLGLALVLFPHTFHRREFFKRKEWATPAVLFAFLGWIVIVVSAVATTMILLRL
ncbi:MAG: hypothetical protein WAU91_05170 [Desulfatitalea sp.]